MKPTLVLHPGLPKCATSSIQRSFVVRNHALARQLGVQFLGREFQPDNGYPEVIRLIDDPQACAADVQTTEYTAGRYFLSNEALSGKREFIAVLRSKFEIEKAVFTIRLPALQAISQYCFSGWISASFDEAAEHPATSFVNAQARHKMKLSEFKMLGVPTQLCPLESDGEHIVTRFCRIAFETPVEIPDGLEEPHVNRSIGLAFAKALNLELRDIGPIPTSFKRSLVKTAQTFNLEPPLNKLVCPEIHRCDAHIQSALCKEYGELLKAYHLDEDTVSEAIAAAADRLDNIVSAPVVSEAEMRSLRQQARCVIEQARQGCEALETKKGP